MSGDGIDWASIRPAIRGWVVAGAAPDVQPDHVIWEGQQRGTPDGMYITIGVVGENDYGYDRQSFEINLDNTITEHITGDRTIRVKVTVYGAITERDATIPWRVASRIRAAASFSQVDDAFTAAVVAIISWTPITAPGRGIDSTAFEPRAMFDVELSCVSDVARTGPGVAGGIIQTVNKSGTIT